MNYPRIARAAFAATVVYFVMGGIVFTVTQLADEFRKYPAVYRTQQDIMRVMPVGMAAMLLSIVVLVVIYALLYRSGSGVAQGARFGALIGLYSVCSFVIHNYVNLNIGVALTVQQAIAYQVQWTVVGIVIGLTYKPKTVS